MTGHAEVIDELLEILEISKESIPTLLSGDNYSGRFLSSSSDTAIQPASLEDLVRNQFV